MAVQNGVNRHPQSIFDLPGLPFDLQQRVKTVGKTNQTVNRASNTLNEEILWTHEIYRGDYSENSNFEIYGLFKFNNTNDIKDIIFRMNGTAVLKITSQSKSCASYRKMVHARGFQNQISFYKDSNDFKEDSNPETYYTINTINSIIFTISSKIYVANDLASLLAAYVRVDY